MTEKSGSIIKIRPHQILAMGDDFGREFKFFIPEPYSGGMSAFEFIVIVKLLNLVDPNRVLEFGTYRGNTTRFILDNLDFKSNKDRKIYTIDLPSLDDVYFEGGDDLLAKVALNCERAYSKSERKGSVSQILCDSMRFDATSLNERFDFILIDANHSYEYVKKDTENALSVLDSSKSVIIWDDFNTEKFIGLNEYISSLAENGMRIYHVEGTNFAIYLSDDLSVGSKINGVILPDISET